MFNNYFTIEKCEKKTARRIQLYLLSFSIIGYLLVRWSPFVYFFKLLGYGDNNGCPVYTLTGIPCPTCGLGRSLSIITQLNLEKFFYYNPSAPFLYFAFAVLILLILILSFFNYRIKLKPRIYKLWYLAVIVVVVVWILNILFGHVER